MRPTLSSGSNNTRTPDLLYVPLQSLLSLPSKLSTILPSSTQTNSACVFLFDINGIIEDIVFCVWFHSLNMFVMLCVCVV